MASKETMDLTMRLFIATPVVLPYLNKLQQSITPFLECKFTKKSNLHLTHLFIGEGEPKEYQFSLPIPNEAITIKGFGFFDERILYMKAQSPHIDAIYQALKRKGLIKEQKPFRPHITIARIKKIQEKENLEKLLESFSQRETKVAFTTFLYQSILTPNGPIYKKIYQYN